jgi:SAM-dependent methyltransferase
LENDEYYRSYYSDILNTGLIGVVSGITHKIIENQFKGSDFFDQVLELGAGKGQHLQYIKHGFRKYYETDYRSENLPDRQGKKHLDEIINLRVDAQDLGQFPDSEFNRLIATCLLVHLNSPELALKEWRRVCANGAYISIYVACEPGIFLRTLRYLTTVQKSRRNGIDHLSIHYREHITFFTRLDLLIKEVFARDLIKRKFWPLRIPSWNFNLATVYTIQIAKIEESEMESIVQ